MNIPKDFLDPFAWLIRNRHRDSPGSGCNEFNTTTQDNVQIHGWYHTKSDNYGTLINLHGFSDTCGYGERVCSDLGFAKPHNLAVVGFDFRHHGRSGDRPLTLGTAEMWDIQAVMSKAEEIGLPKPFILRGSSLGAMAAQRTAIADGRVKGAILEQPPAWPYDAIGVTMGRWVHWASWLIQRSYHWDILKDGDLRVHPAHPSHEPFVLYIMGENDKYGIHKTRRVYHHWYHDCPEWDGGSDIEKPNARKWFFPVAGANHAEGQTSHTIYDWSGYDPLVHRFIEKIMKDHA